MRNWRRSCEDCQSARAELREPQDAARCDRASASAREQRTAKIAVDDAVLLHKFSSEISVDKFLAEIPFPQSQSQSDCPFSVCVPVCVCELKSVLDDDQCPIVGWQQHANSPASFHPFGAF